MNNATGIRILTPLVILAILLMCALPPLVSLFMTGSAGEGNPGNTIDKSGEMCYNTEIREDKSEKIPNPPNKPPTKVTIYTKPLKAADLRETARTKEG